MQCFSSTVLNFIGNNFSEILTIFAIGFAWYSWEINCLMTAADRNPKDAVNHDDTINYSFFARRLSHLPNCIALRVFKNVKLRIYGSSHFKDQSDRFLKELISYKKAMAQLKESGHLD